MSDLTFKIVRETKVNTPESLRTIPVGSSVRIACKDFVSMNTVQAAICRLNQQAGYVEYKVTSPTTMQTKTPCLGCQDSRNQLSQQPEFRKHKNK